MSQWRSIRYRLLGGYLLAALLILFIGWFGYVQVRSASQLLKQTILIQVKIHRPISQVESRSLAISNLAREYILWDDSAEKTRIRTQLNDKFRAVDELLKPLEDKMKTGAAKDALDQVETRFAQFKGAARDLLDAHDSSQDDGTYAERLVLSQRQRQLLDAIRQLETVERAVLTEAQESMDDSVSLSLTTTALLSGLVLILVGLSSLYISRQILRPMRRLREGAEALGQGQLEQKIEVRSRGELGDLADTFNQMAASLRGSEEELRTWGKRLEVQVTDRTKELESMVQTQKRLLDTIRQMSTPVVPVHQGVLVMPLVGAIDAERAELVMESLLVAIEERRARVVILDITGVPVVDTAVAQALLQAAQAARLLGAEPVLVGITPPVAETIISLGVDLTSLVTRADLLGGVAYALEHLSTKKRQANTDLLRG